MQVQWNRSIDNWVIETDPLVVKLTQVKYEHLRLVDIPSRKLTTYWRTNFVLLTYLLNIFKGWLFTLGQTSSPSIVWKKVDVFTINGSDLSHYVHCFSMKIIILTWFPHQISKVSNHKIFSYGTYEYNFVSLVSNKEWVMRSVDSMERLTKSWYVQFVAVFSKIHFRSVELISNILYSRICLHAAANKHHVGVFGRKVAKAEYILVYTVYTQKYKKINWE